jgi:hypothetical protein
MLTHKPSVSGLCREPKLILRATIANPVGVGACGLLRPFWKIAESSQAWKVLARCGRSCHVCVARYRQRDSSSTATTTIIIIIIIVIHVLGNYSSWRSHGFKPIIAAFSF